MYISAGEPFEVISQDPLQLFILLLTGGELSQPKSPHLDHLPHLQSLNLADQLFHELAVLLDKGGGFVCHCEFEVVDGLFEMREGE